MIPQFKMRNGKCPENPGPDKEAKFTILVKTDCPFILTENGFYDNEKRLPVHDVRLRQGIDFKGSPVRNMQLFTIT